MFATLVIILPSPYTGGEAHLSHSGQRTVIDYSINSLTSTSILAWYTDVTHEIKPITSGFRLALSYNLVHTTTRLRPSLVDNTATVSLVKDILTDWTEEDEGPEKIVYLLSHQYSQNNLSGSALKGKDAQTVAALNCVAEECGFELGLALAEVLISGQADDYGEGYSRRSKRERSYDDGDDIGVSMGDIYETTFRIMNLVNLSGVVLSDHIDIDDEAEETIPGNLQETLKGGKMTQSYEGYQGNVSYSFA